MEFDHQADASGFISPIQHLKQTSFLPYPPGSESSCIRTIRARGVVNYPGLIQSGFAAITYQSNLVCLLAVGDVIHASFQVEPLGVKALTDLQLAAVPQEQMEGEYYAAVATMMRQAFRLTSKPAISRTADLLLELAAKLSSTLEDEVSLRLPLTQDTLGQLLGVSGVHLSRVLAILRENGLVQLRRRQLKISSKAALAKFAAECG